MVSTRVGYTGGDSPDPTYGSVCAGDGHTEALKVEFDPSVVSYEALLAKFLSVHDPCVSMTTQYQSAVWPQNRRRRRGAAGAGRARGRRGRLTHQGGAPEAVPRRGVVPQAVQQKNKLRLAAAAGVFLLNNAPHGSYRAGTTQDGAGRRGVPQPSSAARRAFDKILAVFD